MKNLKLTLIALLIILSGCDKEETPQLRTSAPQPTNMFTGNWASPHEFCDTIKILNIKYLTDSTVLLDNTVEMKIYLNTIESDPNKLPYIEGQFRNDVLHMTKMYSNYGCGSGFTKIN